MTDELGMRAGRRGEIAVSGGEHGEPANVLGDLLGVHFNFGAGRHCERNPARFSPDGAKQSQTNVRLLRRKPRSSQ